MKRFVLFVLIALSKIHHADASHANGGEITYKCLGANQYQIQFKFYRGCSGIPAPSTMDIVITNSCGFTVAPVILNPTPTSPTEISPVCSGTLTTCNGGVYTGLEEWVYSGTVVLPGECADWTFAHSESARTSSTTTTGTGYNLYIYSVLNNMNGICDDSPTFLNNPITLICVGQRLCFNYGAYDIQGDSLYFQLISPRTGPTQGDTITYAAGYSYSQPLLSNPPMTLNTQTGEICMTPVQSDVTTMALLVSSYRNGVLIGQIERDMQFAISACNTSIPSLLGFNGSLVDNITVCANQQNCFYITAIDPDPSNATIINWDLSIPNTTTINSSGNRDTLTICWTPSNADAQRSPFTFTATVVDNNCPYIGTSINTYHLYVDTSPTCIPTITPRISPDNMELKIFPQPASGTIHFYFGGGFNLLNGYSLLINDMQGRSVFRTSVTEQSLSADVRNMKGVYCLTIQDKRGLIIKREKIIID